MTQDSTHTAGSTGRRTLLKAVGAAAASTVAFGGSVTAETVDGSLDLDGDAQEVLVTFGADEDTALLGDLDLVSTYHAYESFPVAYTELTGTQIETVADWDETRAVVANAELELEHDDARPDTNADAVQAGEGLDSPYTGENVHAAVIDTGIDAAHPDLEGNVVANWQWVGDPLADDNDAVLWADVGLVNSDDVGHGTHCAGSIGGDGTASDGRYRGMAPDVDLTAYATNASLTVQKATAAYDHLIDRQRAGEHTVHVASNSYGSGPGEFDPYDPLTVAMWYAMEEGVLTTFSAGNDGDGNDTLGVRKQAPYTYTVAATDDEQEIVDFSSRGDIDGNHDRRTAFENVRAIYEGEDPDGPVALHRPAVAAKGADVMSTLNPAQPLWAVGDDDEEWYGLLSGTSMANPVAAGCAVLAIDAYVENHGAVPRPIDLINTMEATADTDADEGYTTANAGAGYVDALAASKRTEEGELADFEDVTLAGE